MRAAAVAAEEPNAKIARTDGSDEQMAAFAAELGLSGATPRRVWVEVPSLDELDGADKQKAIDLCRALYEACFVYGAEGCTVPQLGSHFKVQTIKKDPCFNHMRLADIIKRHDDVFEMMPDSSISGGWRVKLKPGAMAALPGGAPVAPPELERSNLPLPKSIEDPQSAEEKFQALRINVIHALYKRGGKAVLHDLGQEPKIVELRKDVLHGKPLLQFIRVFPGNFGIEDMGNGNFMIELTWLDVSETSMIPGAVEEFAQLVVKGPPGGKGKGKAKGMGMMMNAMMFQMMLKGKGKAKAKAMMSMNPMLGMMMMGKGKGPGMDPMSMSMGMGMGMPAMNPMMLQQMMMAKGGMGMMGGIDGMSMDGMSLDSMTLAGMEGLEGMEGWGIGDMEGFEGWTG